MKFTRRQILAAAGAGVVAAAVDLAATTEPAAAAVEAPEALATGPTAALTTLANTVVPDAPGPQGYRRLKRGDGESHYLRTDLVTRYTTSVQHPLVAFAQLSDLHIIDDQSPLRVEFLDRLANPVGSPFGDWESAYRPQEFLSTQLTEAMVRTIRQIARGPVFDLPFKFTVVTGDAIDNCQYNETRWYIDLLDGNKQIWPDSGTIGVDQSVSSKRGVLGNGFSHDLYYWSPDGRALPAAADDDYVRNAGYPNPPGLLASARQPFTSTGLGMDWYAVFGNHDREVQGNLPVDFSFLEQRFVDVNPDQVARGSDKVIGSDSWLPPNPSQDAVIDFLNSLEFAETSTPDENRRLLDQSAFMAEHLNTSGSPVGHGFRSAPGLLTQWYTIPATSDDVIQFITLDTTKRDHASGQVGAVQLQWLETQLKDNSREYLSSDGKTVLVNAQVQDRLIVVFAHHNIDSIDNKDALVTLLLRYPNVIAMVDGHTHSNRITPFPRPSTWAKAGGFWEINSASHIDWPIQSRIIEIGAGATKGHVGATVSIFTTVVDIDVPATPTGVAGPVQLASWGRELALNDPTERRIQASDHARSGGPQDRNTQLLLPAPFFIPTALRVRTTTPMSAIARSADRMDLFAVATDNRTMWNGWDSTNGWSGWLHIMQGTANSGGSPVTGVSRGQLAEAYTVSQDNRVVRATNLPGQAWVGWQPVPGGLVARTGSTVTAVSRSADKIDLFALAGDGRIMSTWYNDAGGWAGSWFNVQGGTAMPTSTVSVVARNSGSLDVFMIGTDNRPRTAHWDTAKGWSGWSTLGTWQARSDAKISVVTRDENHMDLFSVGLDGRIITTWWSAGAGWASEWVTVGTQFVKAASTVSAIHRGSDHIDLFVVGTDDTVRSTAWSSSTGWLAWSPLAAPTFPNSDVAAVSRTSDRFDIFYAGTDTSTIGEVMTIAYSTADGLASPRIVATTN